MQPPMDIDPRADVPDSGARQGATRRDLLKYAAGGAVVLGLGGAATLGRADRSYSYLLGVRSSFCRCVKCVKLH